MVLSSDYYGKIASIAYLKSLSSDYMMENC